MSIYKTMPRWHAGRLISYEMGQSCLKPSQSAIRAAAQKFDLSPTEVWRALSSYNDCDGISHVGREPISIRVPQ